VGWASILLRVNELEKMGARSVRACCATKTC
jgi:hypothetical protein